MLAVTSYKIVLYVSDWCQHCELMETVSNPATNVGFSNLPPILIVEDDEDDIFFFLAALSREGITRPISIVRNGEEAVSYLDGKGKYADRAAFPPPGIIFTDLKMPGMDGFGLLEWLKMHLEWSVLPSVVYSSSDDPNDVKRAYRLGANAYIVKPLKIEEAQKIVRATHDFWTRCAVPQIKPSK